MDLRRVGPVLCGLRDRLDLAWRRVVAEVHADAQRAADSLQRDTLLGRRPFVDAEQARMFGAGDELGGADVGRQHRLLDQLVRLGAHARNDLLDATVVVADDLRLGRLEVDRAALGALLQQRAVDLVQVQQVRHEVGALAAASGPRVLASTAATSV